MQDLKIHDYLKKHEQWYPALLKIRKELLKTELKETIKWKMPVYTIGNQNVVGISGFKNHFGLWFFQGVFLSDPLNLLTNAQEGKTKAMRHLKYFTINDLNLKTINSYVKEAILNAKDGKSLKPEKKKISMPETLKTTLDKNANLKILFNKLSIGKQKEFYEYIGSAKRENTINKRLEEAKEMITLGKSPMDKYRK